MFGKHKTDALVVGAGPVGMLTALSLAQRGVGVEIIDAQWRPAARSYALALHPQTLALIEGFGFADELIARGTRIGKVAFYEGPDRRAEVDYGALDGDYPFLLILPQQAFEDALERKLVERKIKVRWNHRLARMELGDEQATAWVHKLDKDSVGYATATTEWVVAKEIETHAKFLVGADGHSSLVRRALELPFSDLGGTQYFGVFEFAADIDIAEVRVVLEPERTNVLWPLGGGRFRWSFQMEPPNQPSGVGERPKSRLSVQIGEEVFPYLDRDRLGALIAERAPWFTARIGDIMWSLGVRFERRLVERFGRQMVWLVGDAAHLAMPVGVHSMNVGLREGDEVARCVAGALQGADTHGGLSQYSERALEEWRHLLAIEGGVTVSAEASDWVRDHADRLAAVVPATGRHRETLLSQIGLSTQSG
ncbi:FAD-dependent oxidoreductase [Haliangium sp.]|uniref:FAD-dependent oxidoreductase n=1 Tax=Haliangium sp. TaxID=2663208 RepID=UPI003D0F83DE